jgi:hypothetical protein
LFLQWQTYFWQFSVSILFSKKILLFFLFLFLAV